MFEDVVAAPASALDSPSARALARQAAIEGLVLLQNSAVPAAFGGQMLLPLGKPPALTKIAVLGLLGGCPDHTVHGPPFSWCAAKQAQIDDYSTGWGGYGTTITGYASLQVSTVDVALRRRGYSVSWVAGASPDCQPSAHEVALGRNFVGLMASYCAFSASGSLLYSAAHRS